MNLRDRVGAYRAIFWSPATVEGQDSALTPAAERVLADLARICYVNKTTASANPTQMAIAEGRRQVWLHIQAQLALTDAQVHRILTPENDHD